MTSVFDLDLPKLQTEDLDRLEALDLAQAVAKESWIARTDLGVAVLHQADVAAILRDRRFHSALSKIREMNGVDGPEGDFFANRRPSILSMEGEEHTRLRRLVSPAFTPAAADRHRPAMRRVITELLAPHLDAGRIELMAEVCEPYPIPIICEVLGAPAEDWRLFSEWATGIFKIFNGNLAEDLPDIEAAATALAAYIGDLVEERRHVTEVGDRDADLADLAGGLGSVRVVAGLGRQVEGDRQACLPLGQVGAVELVGGGGGGVA